MTIRWRLAPFLVAIIVFALDQVSKMWIRANYPLSYAEVKIEGFFNLVHAENPGAAFSMFESAPSIVRVGVLVVLAFVIVAVIVLALLGRIHLVETQFARMALGLVLGGACGNLYDRINAGTVTDFLEFYHRGYYFPAFNLADSCIFCGACLMLIDYTIGHRKASASNPAAVDSTPSIGQIKDVS
jgi:signal peptidase II